MPTENDSATAAVNTQNACVLAPVHHETLDHAGLAQHCSHQGLVHSRYLGGVCCREDEDVSSLGAL